MRTLSHRFLGIDEGKQQLALIDTEDAGYGWTMDLTALPLARDLQRLDRERALVGFDRGFFEIDIARGAVLRVCAQWSDVTAVTRLPDGSTVLTGMDLTGAAARGEEAGVDVITLRPDLSLRTQASRRGDYVRLMRVNADGNYLLCTNDHILETTPDLEPLRRLAAPGFQHAWMAQRQSDGTTLVSAGYGAFMARFDRAGTCVSTFGHADALPAEVAPFFYASFQRLADGRLLVANWQDHGPDNGHKGRQLLEFSPDDVLTGCWSDPKKLSSLQGLLVL
jgi:hypothetical protein